MTHDERLERHLELCKKVYERMKDEGTWPWPDSQNFDVMVESENKSNIA